MPIYEYKCLECDSRVEKMQKISEEPLTVCESCGGKLEKQVSLSGFQFKGAGWYVTDYAGKKADKTDKTPDKTDKTDKTDTPAAKTEKSSTGESTTKTETASNTTKTSESNSRKD